jgi:hypothetical protein
MRKVDQYSVATRIIKPGFDWSIGFDKPLDHLFASEGIEDPDEQMKICEVLCSLGLADHKLFGAVNTKTQISQDHRYSASRKLRRLIDQRVT